MPAETPLTGQIRPGAAPPTIEEYERAGGYAALRKAIQMSPADVIKTVADANLRGRGGAGFGAGQKWQLVPRDAPHPRYLVANADEMEPGTFKDRVLLEGNPHQLIEGMIIAAYAVEASTAYVFLRWAYVLAAERVRRAIEEATARGYLGEHILGSDFSLDLKLHVSAGRYMCGEETGLLNALEGKRANPRSKPPYPTTSGLWGKPTVINNVETLSNVPHIVQNGADWFKSLSQSADAGTKMYGVSGKVKSPGAWELPMGTTIRQLIEEHAGGMRDGTSFRGVLPGGASTDFLVAEHLDTPMDFDSVQRAGSRLGTGTMIVLDDQTCPVGMLLNLEHFFAQESCGWCTPCWAGLQWTERLLQGLEDGHGRPEDIERLEAHPRLLRPGNTFCLLAPGAMEPLQSGLRYFRDDFERHIREQRCPWRSA